MKEDETYRKDEELLAYNKKGLVPTIIDTANNRGVTESLICVEYVNDLVEQLRTSQQVEGENEAYQTLLPADPLDKAECRKVSEWVNKEICSPFYIVLVRKDPVERKEAFQKIVRNLALFSKNLQGPFYFGNDLSAVDVNLFPWAYRFYLLKEFRGEDFDVSAQLEHLAAVDGEDPISSSIMNKYNTWYDSMLALSSVSATVQDKDRLKWSYRRYAEGTAKSKVGEAIREGKQAHDIL